MKRQIYILALLLSCVSLSTAQISRFTADKLDSLAVSDTLPDRLISNEIGDLDDELRSALDSLINPLDSTQTTEGIQRKERMALTISKDAPEAKITYGARDTQWLENATSKVHLYGDAYVKYEDYEIRAGYIIFSFEDNTAYAESVTGPDGEVVGKPSFTDGTQNFTYNRLKYNFKTKKGIVYDAVTTEGEFFIHGAKTKFVSSESDSLLIDDEIYNQNALITTCNHDHPHFGLRATKLKVIPQKLAVIGPTNLEIAGVSTPIWLPFGFFPIAGGASDGLIFPRDYKYDGRWGFGLLEVGYYFPINDFVDFKLTGDIYTRGSYGLRAHTNYKKRYKYNGYVKLGFSDTKEEDATTGLVNSQKSFSILLSHTQDSRAHPYRTLSGTIDFQTGGYQTQNFTDAGSQFQNIYSSSLNYTYDFPDNPLTLTAGMNHKQNTATNTMNITLPNITLSMRGTKPFQRKNRGGNEKKWYEDIVLGYTNKTLSTVNTTDSLLFTREVLDDIQYGMSHDVSTSVSLTAFDYLNIKPSIEYDEIWFFRTLDRDIDPLIFESDSTLIDVLPGVDSIYSYDTTYVVQDEFINNFKPYRKIDIGIGFGTQLFGTQNFSKGWLRGVRHHMKPNLNFKYVPQTNQRYEESYYTDVREALRDSVAYNPFPSGVFGTPRLNEEQLSIGYSLTNIIEAKYWSKKDSVAKKFRVFDNISLSGSYNFAADSLKWSKLNINANTKLFKGLTNFTFGTVLDPYVRDEDGNETATTIWSQQGKPLQFLSGNASFTTRLTFKQIFEVLKGKEPSDDDVVMNNNATRGREYENGFGPNALQEIDLEEKEASPEEIIRGGDRELEEEDKKEYKPQRARFLDLINNFKVNHTIGWRGAHLESGKDSIYLSTNSLSFQGQFNVTDNWDIKVNNITYDFRNKSLVYPSFTFARNLHCWRMNFTWQPSGGAYSFFIGVTSSQLDFIKYKHGQNNTPGGR